MRFRYSYRELGGDLSGGFVAALIALPYGLAMAALMGLPPVLGVYTSLLTAPVTALLGRNPVLIGGTASATVPFLAAASASQGIGGAAKVSIVAAVFMMAFCVLKLGRYVQRVPHAVVSGFSCGIGAMMVISQLDSILGLPHAAGSALTQLGTVLVQLGNMRWQPLLIAGTVIVSALWLGRHWPKLPVPLIAVLLAAGVELAVGFREPEVGLMSTRLPDFVGFSWTPRDTVTVLPAALALAIVTSVNLLITSRVVEHFRGRHQHMKRTDADAELGAYGIANVVAGMFGAPVSVGIPARSLANVRCGATTRVSNLAHAAFLGLFIMFGSGIIAHTPLAALAGVTAWMGFCLLDWSTWRRLPKMRRVDAAAFLITAAAVTLTNAVAAVALGCLCYGCEWVAARAFSSSRFVAVPDPERPA